MTELAADNVAPHRDDGQDPGRPDSAWDSPALPDQSRHGTLEQVVATSGRAAAQVVDRLRNNAELTADRGTTIIVDEVVEKIAGIASRQVVGVYDLGGDVSRVFSAVKERIGLGQGDSDQGVSVRLDGGRASVKVTLVVEYGFVVHSVAEDVRVNVIDAVENLLGLEVTAVDIVIDDVHVPDGAPATVPATAGTRADGGSIPDLT
jgi:uncharacterized alkaline shock family protein YloU